MAAELRAEDIEIHAAGGVALRATVIEPPGGAAPRAVAVLSHAMFARRTEWLKRHSDGRSFADALALAGARVVAFDFRGHGDSGAPASAGGFWSFDDLVTRDLPTVVDAARLRAGGAPVVVVGHSLGGSVALAATGAGLAHPDAIVAIASRIGLPRWDPSPARRALIRAMTETMRQATARVGYFPARSLRQGSDDEAAPFVHDLVRFIVTDAWKSEDGAIDYGACLARIDVPVLAFASTADRVQCPPACMKAMLASVRRAELRIVSDDAGRSAPDHMGLVMSASAVRDAVARFVVGAPLRSAP